MVTIGYFSLKWIKMDGSLAEWVQKWTKCTIGPNDTRGTQMDPNGPKWTEMDQKDQNGPTGLNGTEWVNMDLFVVDWIQWVQNGHKWTKSTLKHFAVVCIKMVHY